MRAPKGQTKQQDSRHRAPFSPLFSPLFLGFRISRAWLQGFRISRRREAAAKRPRSGREAVAREAAPPQQRQKKNKEKKDGREKARNRKCGSDAKRARENRAPPPRGRAEFWGMGASPEVP